MCGIPDHKKHPTATKAAMRCNSIYQSYPISYIISAIGIPHTDIPILCKSVPTFGFSKSIVNSARLFLAMNTAKSIVMKYIAICAPSVPRNITVMSPTTSNMIQNRKLVSAILISLYSLDFLSIVSVSFLSYSFSYVTAFPAGFPAG